MNNTPRSPLLEKVREDYMTIEDVMEYTGLTRAGVNKMLAKGRLEKHRIPLAPRRIWFSRAEVEALSQPQPEEPHMATA